MTQEEEWLLKEGFGGEKTEGFFAACERLKAGEPLAYLIGHVPFLGATIYLDTKPLIPRAETEYWVEKAIGEIEKIPAPRVLDLCAGSGCIGVAVLVHVADAHVDLAEIDVRHGATINRNITENRIDPSRTRIINGNLFETIDGEYDFILSNPPYIDEEAGTVDASVLKHEPREALFGGRLGVELIARIIAGASARLTQEGLLYIEHEPPQGVLIQELASKYDFDTVTHKDQYGTERYSVLSRKMPGSVSQ